MCRTYMAVRTSGYITFLIGTPVVNTCIQQNTDCSFTFIGPCIVMYFCSKNQLDAPVYRIYFILFWNDILHVSDGLSVHHQEFKTVHTATGICQTDTANCLLASSQQYLNVQSWIPDDGRKNRPKHIVLLQNNKINLRPWCIYLVLL